MTDPRRFRRQLGHVVPNEVRLVYHGQERVEVGPVYILIIIDKLLPNLEEAFKQNIYHISGGAGGGGHLARLRPRLI